MLGTMPIYAMFRYFGANQETAYQLWWLTIISLNFWVCYLVIKRWFSRTDIAILVAWIFAFSIFNMGQLNYMQMIIRFMVPVVIYAAAKWVETGKLKYFAYYSFGIVIQYYTVIYTGFFLMYFSFGFIFLYVLITKNYTWFKPLFSKKNLIYTTLIVTVCILLMLRLMLPYYLISKELGLRR